MEDQFVSLEIATNLKEKGFKEDCLGFYNCNGKLIICNVKSIDMVDSILAPTWQQVDNWLMTQKGVYINVYLLEGTIDTWSYDIFIVHEGDSLNHRIGALEEATIRDSAPFASKVEAYENAVGYAVKMFVRETQNVCD
jgi:hypothetical protein